MAVRIRLQRRGAHKKPFYHIVVAESRAPRDGKFIEKIGVYNPLKKPAEIRVETDRYNEWIRKGAQPSVSVVKIVRQAGRAGAVAKEA